MVTIRPLLAKILIQVGADEPKEIGTIEIPINISVDRPPVTRNAPGERDGWVEEMGQ